jgi:hypothetical protein
VNLEERPFEGLPGEEIISKGLHDFAAGVPSIESLLLQIGEPRLQREGIRFDRPVDPDADYKLYELLGKAHGNEAHSQYNAWVRRLVSFERALEHRNSWRSRLTAVKSG